MLNLSNQETKIIKFNTSVIYRNALISLDVPEKLPVWGGRDRFFPVTRVTHLKRMVSCSFALVRQNRERDSKGNSTTLDDPCCNTQLPRWCLSQTLA